MFIQVKHLGGTGTCHDLMLLLIVILLHDVVVYGIPLALAGSAVPTVYLYDQQGSSGIPLQTRS